MKQISFLLPDGSLKLSSLFGAIEIFERANEFAANNGEPPEYAIELIGNEMSKEIVQAVFRIGAGDSFKTSEKIETSTNHKHPRLIIIPGMDIQDEGLLERNSQLIDWLAGQYKEGAELASLCTGSYFLAATGLLKNIECSTHWRAEAIFRKTFPSINLRTDKIITDSKGIYTAGGANSSFNLILYLVEKYSSRDAALYCAKVLQIDIDRNSQSPFILFEGQKNHEDEEIRQVQHFIEANLEERISVEELADRFSIPGRSFVRRFKKATNNSPIEYIQRVKIEAAKRHLERGRKNVNEVMYAVGYSDIKAFRNIFRKVAGMSPIDYRSRYAKDSA